MKSLKFYLTAENVFTLTNYTGQDPEVGVKLNGPFSVVVDNSLTPPTKSLLFGISTQF
jgi:hypothetical protein